MLPLALLGGGTAVELTHADARLQSFVCSVAKSSLELPFQKLVAGVETHNGLRVRVRRLYDRRILDLRE